MWTIKPKVRKVVTQSLKWERDAAAMFPPSFSSKSFPPNLLLCGQGFLPAIFFFSLSHSKWCWGVAEGLIHIFTFSLTSRHFHAHMSCEPTAGDLYLVSSFLGRTKTIAGAHGDFPDCNVIIAVVDIPVWIIWMDEKSYMFHSPVK